MSNHIDELNGKMKQEYGKLRGDANMEAQGADQAELAHAEHVVDGAVQEAAGAVEEYIGGTLANPLMTADGEAKRQLGDLEQKG